jgi:hypothetical protein
VLAQADQLCEGVGRGAWRWLGRGARGGKHTQPKLEMCLAGPGFQSLPADRDCASSPVQAAAAEVAASASTAALTAAGGGGGEARGAPSSCRSMVGRVS